MYYLSEPKTETTNKKETTDAMIFQKILAFLVRTTSKLLRCQSDSSYAGSGEAKGPVTHNYFYGFGPRVLALRDGKLLRLTGVFAVIAVYGKEGRLESCMPFLSTLRTEDRLYFGEAAQAKYRELYPRRDRGEPMFSDDTGVSFG